MTVQASDDRIPKIAATTAIGTVHLTIPSLERSCAFYEQAIGLRPREQADGSVLLGAAGSAGSAAPLLSLAGDGSARPRNPRETGLYHFAILLPTRRDLAVALVRLAQAGWRLDGASDHLVSEALYLTDPDGNGIEIYRDRDRAGWRFDAGGRVEMATLPLDLESLLGELDGAPFDPLADAHVPAGTRIGHVHLQVAELDQIERFYAGVLGFDVTARLGGTALFVSAGGYHHHIGLNTWQSRGGAVPPVGGVGLRAYELRLGDQAALDALVARLEAAGIPTEPGPDAGSGPGGDPGPGAGPGPGGDPGPGGGSDPGSNGGSVLVRDPSGNGVVLAV